MTVLVVEDEFLICESISQELRDAGYDVIGVSNADRAIAVLEFRPDIRFVFTDVDMPGSMDGLKLAAFVKDRWPPVKIIVTSGKYMPKDVPPDIKFIPKPYRSEVVIEIIATLS